MYTDDIINVPDTDTIRFEGTTVLDEIASPSPTESDSTSPAIATGTATPAVILPESRPAPNRAAIASSVIATLVLLATIAFVVFRSNGTETAAPGPTASPSVAAGAESTVPDVAAASTSTDAAGGGSAVAVSTAPTVPAGPAITSPALDVTPPMVPAPVEPPAPSPVDTLPPVEPPAPVGELAVQADYVLDPGVDAVSVLLSNSGDRALSYEISNDGAGFTADQPAGVIDPGGSENVWIDLDLVAEGDGPTPFEQVVQITSDGGDAAVTISGQVEKPGFVIAELEDMPIVDYRATVKFTNVGGLPVEITGIEAPGLTFGLISDQIAAGETIDVDVLVCASAGPLPINTPFGSSTLIGSAVTLETVGGPDVEPQLNTTKLLGPVDSFEPLDCSPMVDVPVGGLAISLG